ncbi:MAG: TetR family transcriptional regulator [Rhizobiaceae bacterium]|nr:TetR family transcriptional regulator [Rhizobiaceae bacterium]
MARLRTIDSDALLDAAERVAIRDGAVGLTIDAVAREAKISKSRVIYDYKSKSGLLQALVERRLRLEAGRVAAAVSAEGDSPNPELCGRIAAAKDMPDDDDRAIALTLCAAMSSEEPMQAMIRDVVSKDIEAVTSRARCAPLAVVAYLALHGMMSLEYLDIHRWSDGERGEILAEILKLSHAASAAGGREDA